jgi:hypothetical protein
MKLIAVLVALTVLQAGVVPAGRQVAITIDDLPRGGDGSGFRRWGYTFVTLDQALADDAYRLPEEYVGRNGFSWIHRWSRTRGMAPKGEPDPPKWVLDAYAGR